METRSVPRRIRHLTSLPAAMFYSLFLYPLVDGLDTALLVLEVHHPFLSGLIQLPYLAAILLLANLALGRPVPSRTLLKREWRVLLAALLPSLLLPFVLEYIPKLRLLSHTWTLRLWMAAVGLLVSAVALWAVVLLGRRLLAPTPEPGEPKPPVTPATWWCLGAYLAMMVGRGALQCFTTRNVGGSVYYIFCDLLLVLLAYTLAGGRLLPFLDEAPVGEPLPMLPEQEAGRRRLLVLLGVWLGLMLLARLVAGQLPLVPLVSGICLAVFLYYGRSWARYLWFAEDARWLLGVLVIVGGLAAGVRQSPQLLLAIAANILAGLLHLGITIQMLRKNNKIRLYLLYCIINPVTSRQQKHERLAIGGLALMVGLVLLLVWLM